MMKEIEQTENRFLLEKPDEPFVIKNDDEAMWAQKKIREKMAQKEANKAIAKDAADCETLFKSLKETGHGDLVKTETTEKLTITKSQLQNKFAKVNGHLVDKETGEVIDGIKYEERPKHIAFRFAKETDTDEDK